MIQIYQKLGRGMSRVDMPPISSISELFTNIDRLLPEIEQRAGGLENIFYTLNESGTGDREFERFTHFAFDIDYADMSKWETYHEAAARVLQVERQAMTVVVSGHGLHLLVEVAPENQFTDSSLYSKKRLQYRAICTKLETELKQLGLPGKVDSGVFDRARIMRMPGTINAKPNKEPVRASLVHLGEHAAHVDMTRLSGIEIHEGTKPKKGTKSGDSITWLGANDDTAILEGCEAIKYAQTKPKQVDEPMWYALDSVVGRLKGGRAMLHEWAKARPDYDEASVDSKISQALEQSGPRTCESIEGLWDGCKGCKFYKKVTSPIQIQGPDFIATEETGFHKLQLGANGQLVKRPCFEDLYKFFKKKYHCLTLEGSQEVRALTGGKGRENEPTYYEPMAKSRLESFAQNRFDPFADTRMTREFANLVQRSNLVSADWFRETTENKLNLLNGVYLLKERRLVPHSSEFGFLSQLSYNFEPGATCPTFDRYLQGVTCGDKDLEEAIVQFLAYALSGDKCYAAKILILTGEGKNGKSTLLEIMHALFGEALISLDSDAVVKQFDRQRLDGALACVLEEMPSFKDKNFWEQMKNLATGGRVTVSKKFEMPYEITNRAKFIITCNTLPGGTDPSHGFFRRLLIVPFNAQFTREDGTEDKFIAEKIIAHELPGVLNRLLEAHARLTANNYELPEPGASKGALKEFMLDRDIVLHWFESTLRRVEHKDQEKLAALEQFTLVQVHAPKGEDPVPYVTNDAAYAHFRAWCEEQGILLTQILTHRAFVGRLKAIIKPLRGVEITERRIRANERAKKVILNVVPIEFDA